jgi:hypothetical protein
VESTLAEVLILNGLGESTAYQVVTWAGLKILLAFEGRRDGGAWLAEARTGPSLSQHQQYNTLLLFVKDKRKSSVWSELADSPGAGTGPPAGWKELARICEVSETDYFPVPGF